MLAIDEPLVAELIESGELAALAVAPGVDRVVVDDFRRFISVRKALFRPGVGAV